jgi:hypothetical protein
MPVMENGDSTIDRQSAVGFLIGAEDFYRAAVHLADSRHQRALKLRSNDSISYHLHTHSIELSLKAYLRTKGLSYDEIWKTYWHNLGRLLEASVQLGLRPKKPKRTAQLVESLNELLKDQASRYRKTQYLTLPTLAEVRSANERLLAAVEPAVLASANLKPLASTTRGR